MLSHSENPKSGFDNYTAMENSGLINSGWASEFIPRSAQSIREQHNIDTNTVSIGFEYNVSDGETLKESCTLTSETEKVWKYICPPYKGGTRIITLRHDGLGYYDHYSDGLSY